MSRHRRRELGLSTREYEESVILERMFQLLKRNRCATCLVRKPTHVDPDRDELLCSSCVRRCPYAAQVGHDHVPRAVVDRLEAVYARNSRSKTAPDTKIDEKKKHSSHRRKRASPSPKRGYTSPSVSVERHKSSSNRKHWHSSASVSTDESMYNRETSRSKHRSTHRGRRDSLSSGSVTPRGHSGPRRVEEDLFAGSPKGWDDFDGRHGLVSGGKSYERPPVEPYRADDTRQAPSRYHNGYNGGHALDMRASRPQVDPYGYELPATDDMPGMMGIMASRSNVRDVVPQGRMLHPAEDNFSRPREALSRNEYAAEPYDPRPRAQRTSRPDYGDGGHHPPRDYGPPVSSYAPRNKDYNAIRDYKPQPDEYAAPPLRPVGGNPFAKNANSGSDRFNMSNIRLALPSTDFNPSRQSRPNYNNFDSMPPHPTGVAIYGGLYDRRPRR